MKLIKGHKQLLLAALLTTASTTASAAAILFAQVNNTGSYTSNGNLLAGMLTTAGHTVSNRNLNAATYTDFDTFDQIWVYDLFTGADNSANQMANYTGIANWYKDSSSQNLILDGRIISSTPPWAAGDTSPHSF